MKLVSIIGNMKMIKRRQVKDGKISLTLNNGLTIVTTLKDFNLNGLNATVEKVA